MRSIVPRAVCGGLCSSYVSTRRCTRCGAIASRNSMGGHGRWKPAAIGRRQRIVWKAAERADDAKRSADLGWSRSRGVISPALTTSGPGVRSP